ncbi:MAG: class I SAM-dependent methyltransferase [Thermoleophilaceae bacterium]
MSVALQARQAARRVAGPLAPAAGREVQRRSGRIVGELIESRLRAQPELRPWYEAMTDEHARLHFGEDEVVDLEYLRRGLRLFHAWRVHRLRSLVGDRLDQASFLDVGDTDGLMLKHLGQPGIGFNLSQAAIRNIEANGIEAKLGDGQELPFDDGSFDYVLCFETLEHVESPPRLLDELARVCRPGGRVFVSIPWVPQTFVHPRDPSIDRGYGHCFEFCRDDFAALLTHTPLAIRSEDVFELLGPPARPAHRAFLAAARNRHLVGGGFRRFQFFELAHRA